MKNEALWDGVRNIILTPRYLDALKELAEAELEMMGSQKGMSAEDWEWVDVEVGDLATTNYISMTFGSSRDSNNKKGVKIIIQ